MATSIIQIDVQDEKFKAFASAFEKYKASMKDLPKGWAAAGAGVAKMAGDTEKSFKGLLKTNKDLNSSFKDGYGTLKDVSKVSKDIAANFASTALSIAKWVSFSGLIGGFGLGALAANASDVRRQAQGYGVSTGDLRATTTNFGKYIDAESTLSKIANLQNDLAQKQILTRLGGHEGETSAQMLPALVKNAVKQFNAGGKSSQYAEAMGLTQVFSLEELRRLSSLTQSELEKTISDFQRDRTVLAVSDEDSQLMQNFWIQVKRSGEQLETGFIKALAPLAPQLEALSKAVGTAITDFLGSKEVKQALQDFTHWIGSPEAKEAVKGFIDGLVAISKAIVNVITMFGGGKAHEDTVRGQVDKTAGAQKGYTYKDGKIDANNPENYIGGTTWYGKLINSQNDKYNEGLKNQNISSGKIDFSASTPATPKGQNDITMPSPVKAQQFLAGVEAADKLPEGVLDKMWAAESGRGKNMTSAVGAEGHFQFMPATAKEYGLNNPYDFNSSAEAAGKKIKHLLDKYKGNIADALAAYNWGEGNLDKFIAGKNGAHLPKETNDYLHKFGITVNNAAGSDLVITSNGLK